MIKKGFLVIVTLLLLAEIFVRILGIANVPIREANSINGYIPLASQSGRFLLNDWTINSMQMISSAEFNTEGNEVLLVGDSVVFGGNPLSQQQRVGEQLGRLLDNSTSYAIADGSWGFKNGLNYIEQNLEEIRGTDTIIFVLNSGDFGAPSSWRCMSFYPTETPYSYLIFSIRKYFSPICLNETPSNLVVPDFDYSEKFRLIRSALNETRFIIFLYQNKTEFSENLTLKPMLDRRVIEYSEVYELAEYANMWDLNYYRDNIHPNADGAAALARILNEVLGFRELE